MRGVGLFVSCVLAIGLSANTMAHGQIAAAINDDIDANALLLRTGKVTLDATRSLHRTAQGRVALAEPEHFVIQLSGPMTIAQMTELEATGIKLLRYLPANAYIATMPAGFRAAESLNGKQYVRWLGAFDASWKLDPQIGLRKMETPERQALVDQGLIKLTVVLFDGQDARAAENRIAALPGVVIENVQHPGADSTVFQITMPRPFYPQLASLKAVQWVEEAAEMTPRNDTNKWILQSNVSAVTTVWDKGITGQNQVAGHIDGGSTTGVNINHCAFRDPLVATAGPTHRKVVAQFGGTGYDSHATHTGGTFYGDPVPAGGAATYRGMAYSAKVAFATGGQVDSLGLYTVFQNCHNAGSRVHSNSWGLDGTTVYIQWCVDVDRFSYNFEDDLVLFAVTNAGGVVYTPENAKNCMAVNRGSDTPNQGTACGSISAGPTNDGRRKPEIMAPGCSTVSSASSGSTCTFSGSGWTGTSMACPAVAGCGLLARQYYTDGFYPTGAAVPADAFTPTGALIKATLLNSATDMTGITGFPSNSEGWGRVLLDDALFFTGDARKLIVNDVRNATGLTATQSAVYNFTVNSNAQPLEATLVWTEKEATINANPAYINNLNLSVTGPTGTYLGNVFSSGQSATGGSADLKNNVEEVLLTVPAAGAYTLTINAATVNPLYGPQGYALVITGDVALVAPEVPGDCDGNGTFDLNVDTDCFVSVILGLNGDPGAIDRSDLSGNLIADGDDIAYFVDCAVNGCP